jgi:hypothetical protein
VHLRLFSESSGRIGFHQCMQTTDLAFLELQCALQMLAAQLLGLHLHCTTTMSLLELNEPPPRPMDGIATSAPLPSAGASLRSTCERPRFRARYCLYAQHRWLCLRTQQDLAPWYG